MHHIPPLAVIQGERNPVVTPDNATEILLKWLGKYPSGTPERETEYPYLNNPNLRAQFFYDEGTPVIIRPDMAGVVGHQISIDPGRSCRKAAGIRYIRWISIFI